MYNKYKCFLIVTNTYGFLIRVQTYYVVPLPKHRTGSKTIALLERNVTLSF